MKIAIGSDRRGFEYKKALSDYLKDKGHEIIDVGPYNNIYPVDYPIYGEKVGELVSSGECEKGIVICATGIGIMIACNKVDGARCGIAYTDEVARLIREHNDANVIGFGQDQMELNDVIRRTEIFLNANFLAGYHCTRIEQLNEIERGNPIRQTPFLNIK